MLLSPDCVLCLSRTAYARKRPPQKSESTGTTAGNSTATIHQHSPHRLLEQLRCLRDRALILLMLQGGLRPGEALGLPLEDVAYGRRRIVVRHRTDHPKGVRSKSRIERIVELHEPEAL